jgi:hypothetical protein
MPRSPDVGLLGTTAVSESLPRRRQRRPGDWGYLLPLRSAAASVFRLRKTPRFSPSLWPKAMKESL